MFSEHAEEWLEHALDWGISEAEFWNSTLAELTRLIDSKKRIQKREAQEKAHFDYILADLIGRSIARIHSSSNKLPDIADVYPTLFDVEEARMKRQEKKDELSVLRFKQFAQSYNKQFNKEVGNKL